MHQQIHSLEEVKQAFQQWRNTRPKQERIPGYLWELVGSIRSQYSDKAISSTLGVTYQQIKSNLSTEEEMISFVEAVSSDKKKQSCCDIELKRSCGAVIKISSLPISVVSELIPRFLSL